MFGVLWPSRNWFKSVGVGFALVVVAMVVIVGLTYAAHAQEVEASSASIPKSPPIPDQLGKIFVCHQQVQSSRQNACEAAFSVLYGKAPYYQTMVEVPNPKFSKSDEKVEIVPSMTVVIDIIGKKRSVLSYIMTPLNRASGMVFRER